MAETSHTASAARWLLGVTAGVVLVFVLATGISQYLERSIAERSDAIITTAMPSIQLLARARGDLRRLDNVVDQYVDANIEQQRALAPRIGLLQDSVAINVATYAALPPFPDERNLYVRAQQSFDVLAAELVRFVRQPSSTVAIDVHRDLDNFDDSLERINTFDAAQGQRLGRDIERIRNRARGATVGLDGMSVALAIAACVLAMRQFQRAARHERAAQRLRDAREADLATQNEVLGDFAARVAHDILSPLAAATLSFDIIRQTSSDPLTLSSVERAASATRRVHTLVDGLLTFSRAAGQPEPGTSAALAPVLADIVAELRLQAQHNQISLELAPIPDGRIACSEGVLTSIVSNLVRNAIKYMDATDERYVALRVRDAEHRWRIEVEDTGPGISPAHQRKIFEPYVQLDRRSSGIGLGLATVERLVRAHAGSVGVISPVSRGRGSLFWVELPKALATNNVAGDVSAKAGGSRVGG